MIYGILPDTIPLSGSLQVSFFYSSKGKGRTNYTVSDTSSLPNRGSLKEGRSFPGERREPYNRCDRLPDVVHEFVKTDTRRWHSVAEIEAGSTHSCPPDQPGNECSFLGKFRSRFRKVTDRFEVERWVSCHRNQQSVQLLQDLGVHFFHWGDSGIDSAQLFSGRKLKLRGSIFTKDMYRFCA